MTQLLRCAAAIAACIVLAACQNNGREQNSTKVRLVHASLDTEALDLLIADDVKSANVAFGASSGYSTFDSGDRNVKLRSSGSGAVLVDKTVSFPSADLALVVYGKRGSLSIAQLSDTGESVSSGKFKVRLFNVSPDVGSTDLYVTASDISSVPATLSNAGYSGLSAYTEVSEGSYSIVITAAGTKEVLFESTARAFAAGQVLTILVYPTRGGRLVNAMVLTTGSDPTTTLLLNTKARMKAVNGATDSTGLNYLVNGATLLSNVPFKGASSYVVTGSGDRSLQLTASSAPTTPLPGGLSARFDPAADYTVLALGSQASPSLVTFADDNTLPSTAGTFKIRCINAMSGSAVDMLVNFATQVSSLAPASASAYREIAAGNYAFTVATPGGVSVLASLTADLTESSGYTYTLYAFGVPGNAEARLVRDD